MVKLDQQQLGIKTPTAKAMTRKKAKIRGGFTFADTPVFGYRPSKHAKGRLPKGKKVSVSS
jgi:hypothetical protein